MHRVRQIRILEKLKRKKKKINLQESPSVINPFFFLRPIQVQDRKKFGKCDIPYSELSESILKESAVKTNFEFSSEQGKRFSPFWKM